MAKKNIKEIPYTVKPTFGASLDSRGSISSIANLDTELPVGIRYPGLIVFVEDIKQLYYFKNATTNNDFKQFSQFDIVSINILSDISTIKKPNRFVGQLVWVTSIKQFFIFDTGITDSDLHIYSKIDIKVISDISTLSDDIPVNMRYVGQLVWIASYSTMFVFKTGTSNTDLKALNQCDILVIPTFADISNIDASRRFLGQLVYVTSESIYYTFKLGITNANLIPFTTNDIVSISSLSNATIEISQNQRYLGQLVWVRDIQYLYTFKTGLTNNDLSAINETDIMNISSKTNVSSIPVKNRFLGQLIFATDSRTYYIFKNGILDTDLIPLQHIDIQYISTFAGDTGVASLTMDSRFIGQLVWVGDENMMYVFKEGVSNINCVPVRNCEIRVIDSVAALSELTLPSRARFIGQTIFAKAEGAFYTFKNDTVNLHPFVSGNTQTISSLAAIDTELPQTKRYIGQMVYVKDINMLYMFRDNILIPYPFNKNTDIITISDTTGIASIPVEQRFVGQLVYVRNIKMFYIFKKNVTNAGCIPFNQVDVITVQSRVSNLSTNLPTEKRFIGQLVYVTDELSYYTFKNGILDTDLLRFSNFDIKYISVYADVTTIPINQRFVGQLVYVNELSRYFVFKDDIQDVNLKPLNTSNLIIVNSKNSINSIQSYQRFVGQLIYVTDINQLWIFKSGILDADCVPLNQQDIISVVTKTELDAIPTSRMYIGQLGYVQYTNSFYVCRMVSTSLTWVSQNNTDIISIATKGNLAIINVDQRYEGQLIYVVDEKMFYSFIGGTDTTNFVPLLSRLIITVATYNDAITLNSYSRFVGQLIYIDDENTMYCFKTGTADADLLPLNNVFSISTLSALDTELPARKRFNGQMIWIADTKQLRTFNSNITTVDNLVKVQSSIVTITSAVDFAKQSNVDRRPSLLIREYDKQCMVWRTASNRYVNIHSNTIVVGDTVDGLLELLSTDAINEERVIGQLYYIADKATHYTFIDGITNDHFKPINSNYVISTIADVDSIIPEPKRYVGLMFYVVDEETWYFFTSLSVYKRHSGFTVFKDTISVTGDIEYVHNKNINTCILEARNARNELVEVAYHTGYLNELGHTDSDIAWANRNMISISSDIHELLSLKILTL